MNEVIHYNGYMALKRLSKNDIPIWDITKEGEFIANMEYRESSIENINAFNKLINNFLNK